MGQGRAADRLEVSDPSVQVTLHELKTTDNARIAGILHSPGGRRGTVVSIMHPRQDVSHHPLVGQLLARGLSVWTQGPRSVNNDLALVHEQTLLDVAAGQAFLVNQGYDALITLGHSGGGTLYAYYQEQARLAPADRRSFAPSGLPVDLGGADMPMPHASIFLAPHPGQGALLQRLIDPSVTDERDPLSVEPELDAFDPANGFIPAPGPSHYSEDFVARYRSAQLARVQRLDAFAESCLHRQGEARRGQATRAAQRSADADHVMTIYRTDADLRSVDLSIDPNERPYGSLFGQRPDRGNYRLAGFARVTTPAAWLSTWSGTQSHANFLRNAAAVASPTLLIELTGDQACFPADARAMYAAIGATDKTHVRAPGLHFGQALRPGAPTGIELAAQHIGRWVAERFDA
jgi:hypothetical protein